MPCSAQVLKRSIAEVDSVFSDPHVQPSAATVGELPYLEAVILETLRLRPPAYIVGRCASRDVQLSTPRRGGATDRIDVPAGVTDASVPMRAVAESHTEPKHRACVTCG